MLAGSAYAQTLQTNRFTVFECIYIQRVQDYSNKILTLVHLKKVFILPLFVYNAISDIFQPVHSYRQGNHSCPCTYVVYSMSVLLCDLTFVIWRGSLCYHIMTFIQVEDGGCSVIWREAANTWTTSRTQPSRDFILGSEVSLTTPHTKNIRLTKCHTELWTCTNSLSQFKKRSGYHSVGSGYGPVAAAVKTLISLPCP
jgi:hypothetical protein